MSGFRLHGRSYTPSAASPHFNKIAPFQLQKCWAGQNRAKSKRGKQAGGKWLWQDVGWSLRYGPFYVRPLMHTQISTGGLVTASTQKVLRRLFTGLAAGIEWTTGSGSVFTRYASVLNSLSVVRQKPPPIGDWAETNPSSATWNNKSFLLWKMENVLKRIICHAGECLFSRTWLAHASST